MQIYNIGLSLHRFCLSMLVKCISCMFICDWTLTLTCVCVEHSEELYQFFFTLTSTSPRSHRLGDASSSPQSSEGKPIACCTDHHVRESTNGKGDGYKVIGNSGFEEKGRFPNDRSLILGCGPNSRKELLSKDRAFRAGVRLRSSCT